MQQQECNELHICSRERCIIEGDVHICGLCKIRFSDVELFIQHKKFSCPVRVARQKEEAKKSAELVKEFVPKTHEKSNVEPSNRQTDEQDGASLPAPDIIELTSSSEGLVRPVALHMNRGSYPSTIDEYMEVEDEGTPTREASDEGRAVNGDQNQEYILITNEEANNQYGSQVNPSEQVKVQVTSQQSCDKTIENQSSPAQPMVQSINDNMYLLHKGLVPQQLTTQASQLPVFISREITPNASEDNLSSHVQDSGSDDEANVQYMVTFEDGQGQTVSQKVSAASLSNIMMNPKGAHSSKSPQKSAKETFTKTSPSKSVSKSRQEPSGDNKKAKRILEKRYNCNICNYRTAYLKDMERHSRIHTGEKPFQCEECPKTFNRSDKLALHLKYHQNDRSYKCELCEYSAVERSSLKKHMKVHLNERPHACQVCPYKARSASQLQIHLRIHTGDTPYQCKECGAFFKVNSDLKRHGRVHTGEKPHACNFPGCTYRCAIKSNLRSHKLTNHRMDVQYPCETCEFVTSSKRAMFEHKKVHEVNKDLICTICSYQCSNRSALRNHMKMHTSAPYKCNYCSYSSYQSGNVQSHMKRRHSLKRAPAVRSDANPKQVLEDIIETGPSRFALRTKCQKNYKCDQCDAAFVREDSLRCHLKQHTDSPLSTAYAVLKLQNPVINVSKSGEITQGGTQQSLMTQAKKQSTKSRQEATNQNAQNLNENTQIILQHDQTSFQNQTANLGINDILAAARLSASCGNSPTLNKPLEQFIFHEGSDMNSTLTAITTTTDNSEDQTITISQPSDQTDVSAVQLMQNISLPYMRLPNGQILLLTGQNPTSPVLPQSNIVTSEENSSNALRTAIQTQIIAQQPTSEQEHIINIPEHTGDSSTATISTPQSGAIPIQIILPNDSQQAIPLVSQLLNSIINRGTSEGAEGRTVGQATTIGESSSKEMGETTQNFVVQIPAQSGTVKDSTGGLAESQSFLLQIPGSENFG